MKANVDVQLWDEHASEAGFYRDGMRRRAAADTVMPLHNRLSSGSGIGLANLQVTGGVLAFDGLQVVLYDPDQGENSDSISATRPSAATFHVARCPVLHDELEATASVRHGAANWQLATWPVDGFSCAHGPVHRGLAGFQVCEHCLHTLNYKGYRTHPGQRATIREQFDIAECFARFSTLFGYYPIVPEAAIGARDWQSRLALYRRQRGDTCERCAVGLSSHQHLLCIAHRNADKQDFRPDNLRMLCLDCQRKAVAHAHVPVSDADMRLLQRCRRAQGLLDDMCWDQAIELADTAFDGLLRHYRELAHVVPQIAYQLDNVSSRDAEIVALAWPSQKRGVTADLDTARRLAKLGWHCLTLDEALASMNGQ